MVRPRAPRCPAPALARAALAAALLAAGPGLSALGVARSMHARARPYLLGSGAAAGLARLRPGLPPAAVPPVVRQTRAQSCGPAALASVLAWRGRRVGERAVLARARLGRDGATLAELARLAALFGLPAAWYAPPPRDLPRLPTPFIAHLRRDGGHFVAVARVARGFVVLADPAAGAVVERLERFRREWSGRVLLFGAPAGGGAP